MSNLPISSKYVSSPHALVDEGERETVVGRVNAAFEGGQIDDMQYRAMLDTAFGARTLGELRPVVEQLPAAATYATPGNIVAGTTPPGEVSAAVAPSGRSVLTVVAAVAVAVVLFVALLAIAL